MLFLFCICIVRGAMDNVRCYTIVILWFGGGLFFTAPVVSYGHVVSDAPDHFWHPGASDVKAVQRNESC